jgi:hypothetical protein
MVRKRTTGGSDMIGEPVVHVLDLNFVFDEQK